MIFVYSGQMRTLKNFHAQLKLIHEIFGSDCTILCGFWSDDEVAEQFSTLCQDFHVDVRYFEPKNFTSCEHTMHDEYSNRILSQFYSISSSFSLLTELDISEHEDTIVVRMRTDLIITREHLLFLKNFSLSANVITFPHVGHYIGVNDMFWVTNLQTAKIFVDLINYARAALEDRGRLAVPEIILREFVQSCGIQMEYELWHFPSLLVRVDGKKLIPHAKFKVNYFQHKRRARVRNFGDLPTDKPRLLKRIISEVYCRIRCFVIDRKILSFLKGVNSL